MPKFKVNHLSFTVLENCNYPSNDVLISASCYLPAVENTD